MRGISTTLGRTTEGFGTMKRERDEGGIVLCITRRPAEGGRSYAPRLWTGRGRPAEGRTREGFGTMKGERDEKVSERHLRRSKRCGNARGRGRDGGERAGAGRRGGEEKGGGKETSRTAIEARQTLREQKKKSTVASS
jgi:hypothetical protein